LTENEIATVVVDACYQIHKALGPGLLEGAYEAVLEYELKSRGLRVVCQAPMPLVYKEVAVVVGYRADFLVEDKVIVEIKSIDGLAPVHYKQLLTYLRASDLRLGILVNFNEEWIKDGIKRVVNRLPEGDGT